MSKELLSENQVKDALGIDSFRGISKQKIIQFASLLPNMDREIAINAINQFPVFNAGANVIITQLRELCDNALEHNEKSRKDSVEAYKLILDDLSGLLKQPEIDIAERHFIIDRMLFVAAKIDEIHDKNTVRTERIVKMLMGLGGGLAVAGLSILGVKVKGNLPKLT